MNLAQSSGEVESNPEADLAPNFPSEKPVDDGAFVQERVDLGTLFDLDQLPEAAHVVEDADGGKIVTYVT